MAAAYCWAFDPQAPQSWRQAADAALPGWASGYVSRNMGDYVVILAAIGAAMAVMIAADALVSRNKRR